MPKVKPRKRGCSVRTSNFVVRLIATTTFSTTVDVTAQGAADARQLAEAALKELLSAAPRPSCAESWDIEVEAVDASEQKET